MMVGAPTPPHLAAAVAFCTAISLQVKWFTAVQDTHVYAVEDSSLPRLQAMLSWQEGTSRRRLGLRLHTGACLQLPL